MVADAVDELGQPLARVASLLRHVLREPLLAASLVLFSIGSAWAVFSLVRAHPWLVPLGASFACFVLHWFFLLQREGLLALFPSVELALQRPVFELLCGEVTRAKLRGYKWIRLLVLAGVELDEAEHNQILSELSPDFRRCIFQRPAISLVSDVARRVLLGKRCQEVNPKELLVSDEELSAHSRQTTSSTRILYRSKTVGEFLEAMRNEECATQEEFSKFQKIINDKFGGTIAVPFVKQNALHEAEGFLTGLRAVVLTQAVDVVVRIPGTRTASCLLSALAPRTWASVQGYVQGCCLAAQPKQLKVC